MGSCNQEIMSREIGRSQRVIKEGAKPRFLGGVSIPLFSFYQASLASLALLALLAFPLYSAGQTAAESLLAGVGARPSALGGAYTSLANDPFAGAYNPSGLARIKRPQLALMHTEWLDDMQQQFIAFGLPLKPGVIGLDFYRMDMGKFAGRDASGKPTGEFSGGDMALGLSFGLQAHRRILLGSKVTYFREELAGYKAATVFGDFGAIVAVSPKLVIGAVMQNAGQGLRFIKEESPLPLTYALGAGYNLGGMRLAADYKMRPREKSGEFMAGLEFTPAIGQEQSRPVALRIGQNGFTAGKAGANPAQNFCGGFGLSLGSATVDYAFKPFGVLGATHRMSLLLRF
ncbi:MAG: PorV/PorQ family protein [Elusimicrobia bacterium]|nr:PorV/PorQ family protein [Elusimicrobiota bacterium]